MRLIASIREFTAPSVPIYMYDAQGGYVVKTMSEVFIFLSHHLGVAYEGTLYTE